VSESLSFLNLLIRGAIDNSKIPTPILVDEVMTGENNIFNNTPLGEVILVNLPAILNHFDIEKDLEEVKKIEGTHKETFTPLGSKR